MSAKRTSWLFYAFASVLLHEPLKRWQETLQGHKRDLANSQASMLPFSCNSYSTAPFTRQEKLGKAVMAKPQLGNCIFPS